MINEEDHASSGNLLWVRVKTTTTPMVHMGERESFWGVS